MYKMQRLFMGILLGCFCLLAGTAAASAASPVTILGEPELRREQLVRYIEERNPNPKLSCSVEELVDYYYYEAAIEGVRPDVAVCQAIKETGCFAYGGDVSPAQNNFCGLGATGNKAPGYSFVSAQPGVRAHIQHLVGYAAGRLPHGTLVDPRFTILRDKYPQFYGQVQYWSGLNGKWAVPGTNYAEDILAIWNTIKEK